MGRSSNLPFELPPLPTLHRKPSWQNRAGRVDRSACIEIRPAQVAGLLKTDQWNSSISSTGRCARAQVTITAAHLIRWLNSRLPRQLQGDFRTPKSNAMKNALDPQRRTHKAPDAEPWRAITDYRGGSFNNPNKGAAATKKIIHASSPSRIDLFAVAGAANLRSRRIPSQPSDSLTWSQTFTLERWRLKAKTPRTRIDKSAPPDPTHTFLICPHCRTKRRTLLMPAAHEQELNEAHLAQCWINFIHAHPRWRKLALNHADIRGPIDAFIARYGLLFSPRQFLCIDCLGVRHGEVKRSRRDNRRPHIIMPPPSADGLSELPPAVNFVYRQLRDSIRRSDAVDDIARMMREADATGEPLDPDLLFRIATAGPRNLRPVQRAMRSARKKRKARDEIADSPR